MQTEDIKRIDNIICKFISDLEKEGFTIKSKTDHSISDFKLSLVGTNKKMINYINKKNLEKSKSYGFTQNIVGMEFTSRKGNFVITGFKPENRKYPIIATCIEDGRSYKFPCANVLEYLGGNKMLNRIVNLEKLT